ncbi:MAG: hypothetical protein J7M30_05025 [Deltaproteobacteria bacterium]|nr:hypothetical protein [Deltaproteobacteria bacterium]
MMRNKELGSGRGYGIIFESLFVDFLGSLVPGFLFMGITGIMLFWHIWGLSKIVPFEFLNNPIFPVGFSKTYPIYNYLLIGMTLVLSYVFGFLYFRQDPKGPDFRSFYRQTGINPFREKERLDKKHEHWVVQIKEDKEPQLEDVQFPYSHLKDYLEHRGLRHLADIVPWDTLENKKIKHRTKNFINVLKIRLQYFAPEKCSKIIRNEAHVRFMSSVWYMTRSLLLISGIMMAVDFIAVNILFFSDPARYRMILAPGVTAGLAFMFSWRVKSTIEKFFQYQRVREIVFVLETAYLVAGEYPGMLHLGTEKPAAEEQPVASAPDEAMREAVKTTRSLV